MYREYRAILNIKSDLRLAKELFRVADTLSLRVKTKPFRNYLSEFDLSIADRLSQSAKGRLKARGIAYKTLGEFYTSVTGKDYQNLSKSFLSVFYIERNNFEEHFFSKQTISPVENTTLDSEKD